jgi:nucleotide-binding universal stress UspA family protein
MYRSLLVPLDRSAFAEQALPLALSIARRTNARLDLAEVHALYALDDPHAGWLRFDPESDAERRRQEQHYLDTIARRLTSMSPVSVTTCVCPGSVALRATIADGILERAGAGKADLIVMATHGRGPLSRFLVGSVADELVCRARVPVLLVRGTDKAPGATPGPALNNILIPLDGSPLAEQVLSSAQDLARVMEARCSLLRVIKPSSSGSHAPGELPEKAEAEAYLERVAGRLREQGLEVRTRAVVARHAAEAILQEAQAQGTDLIALATHGRHGLKRLLLGSVADQLLRAAASPVLVYRPTGLGRMKDENDLLIRPSSCRKGAL